MPPDAQARRIEPMHEIIRLSEAAVRAYDTKTEIAMLCFVLSAEAVHIFVDLKGMLGKAPWLASLLFAAFVAALLAFLRVLWPIERLGDSGSGGYVSRAIYFPFAMTLKAEDYLRNIDDANLELEAAHTILALSRIRDEKRRRLTLAFSLCVVFYLLCVLQRLVQSAG